MEPPDEYHPEEQRTFIDKWSGPIFDQGAFTMVPNLLLASVPYLRMTPSELVVLINIESFRWNTRPSFPSVQRLSLRTGMSERHVTRLITSLEKKGILERNRRRYRTNEYDLRPLIETLHDIACSVPDNDDQTTRQNGRIDPDIVVADYVTSLSSKEDTVEKEKLKKKKKNIPHKNIVRATSPVFDLDEEINLDDFEF
jgi:hypothetical protein